MESSDLGDFDAYLEEAIHTAVLAADRVILERCKGNPEILELITVGVLQEFVRKLTLILEQH